MDGLGVMSQEKGINFDLSKLMLIDESKLMLLINKCLHMTINLGIHVRLLMQDSL